MDPKLHHRSGKPSASPSSSFPPGRDDLKPRGALRLLPLLLMAIYAGSCALRLAPSFSSSPSPFRRRVTVQGKTTAARPSETQMISSSTAPTSVQARRGGSPPAVSCSALIDGGDHASPAAAATDGGAVLCCDRSQFRSDVCYMRGHVATKPRSSSIFVYGERLPPQPELIRPYTRKWEASVMSTIDELELLPLPPPSGGGGGSNGTAVPAPPRCDVRHNVPAVVFSTGGYTGNVYHEFSDGLLPLYATAERFGGEVVLLVLEYHSWWVEKYGAVVGKLSNYEMVNLSKDRRVHCFPEMIVGLRIHGELTINPKLTPTGKGIRDFQALLYQSFGPRRRRREPPSPSLAGRSAMAAAGRKPKLVILVRHGTRVLQNLVQVTKAAQAAGFQVETVSPRTRTPMADIYGAVHEADAMVAVHGAALTHLLFMRPGAVLVQIVPLGLDGPADDFYGQPARAAGLEYIAYKVLPEESSLWRQYDRRDPVIADPAAITSKGWPELKKVYLDHQNVRVNIRRFRKVLSAAYSHVTRTPPSS